MAPPVQAMVGDIAMAPMYPAVRADYQRDALDRHVGRMLRPVQGPER